MNKADKKNVLVMFCDQLRVDLLGCYGNTLIRTPNIDALAADSVVFNNAFTPTAICSPARASLMTGLYAHKHNMFNNSTKRYSYCRHLPSDVNMIQDWADEATDYQTGYFGKWHIGPTTDLFSSSFHRTHPQSGEDAPLFASGHGHPNESLGELTKEIGERTIGPSGKLTGTVKVPMQDFPDVQAGRYTREFIGDCDPDRPFLAFCSFPGPHSPWLVPEEYGIRYDPEEIPLWDNRNDTLEGKPINQHKLQILSKKNRGNVPLQVQDESLRQKLSVCFSYIELIDQCVGEVVDYLKREELYENTAIFFTADHGDMANSHGFPSKGSYMYDEIYRIPLIFKPAAGSAPHKRVNEPVHLMDVTATCMDVMAGGEQVDMIGQPLQGRSLRAFEADKPHWERKVHYAQYHGDWYGHYSVRMVTDGRWKLVWNFSDLCELYDLENDPNELRNLFYDPAYRETRDHYFSLLAGEAERNEDGQAMKFLNESSNYGEVEDQALTNALQGFFDKN